MKVCEHCGHELQKVALQREEIQQTQIEYIKGVSSELTKQQLEVGNALEVRQDKLDTASAEMLEIIKRIEAKIGSNLTTLQDIKKLEARVKARAAVKARLEDAFENQDKKSEDM
jgi:uncharacterized Zn finger protein (UPF0148 family)